MASGDKPVDLGSDPFCHLVCELGIVRSASSKWLGDEKSRRCRCMDATLMRLDCAHGGGRGGWQRPSRPAGAPPAAGCAVEASYATFSIVLSTSARGKRPESQGAGPVTPGNWSVDRRVSVACWNLNCWPGPGSPSLTFLALTPGVTGQPGEMTGELDVSFPPCAFPK